MYDMYDEVFIITTVLINIINILIVSVYLYVSIQLAVACDSKKAPMCSKFQPNRSSSGMKQLEKVT